MAGKREVNFKPSCSAFGRLELGLLSLPDDLFDKVPMLHNFLELKELFLMRHDSTDILIEELRIYVKKASAVTDIKNCSIVEGHVLVSSNVQILPGTVIQGPCFIGENSIIGPNAYLRNGTIIGANTRIGFGVETKMAVIFDNSTVSHYGYVGHSLIGERTNIGAGVVLSSRRLDDKPVILTTPKGEIQTNQWKFGSVIEQDVRIGASITSMPGTWISAGACIMPKQNISGLITRSP